MLTVRAHSLFSWLMGAALACACGAALPEPVAADAVRNSADAGMSLSDLQRGRTLYLARCGACHALRDPLSEPARAWGGEVQAMRSQNGVHLSDEEARQISGYLSAIASR